MSQQDQVIEEFLEGHPRAEYWRELRETLTDRLKDAIIERDAAGPDAPTHAALDKRVRELQTQVAALATEEAVTQFVEDSVRQSVTRPHYVEEIDIEDDW